MKFACCLVMGAVAVGGCAGRMPEPKAPTMVRSFHGALVPGYYVSPSAYEQRYLGHRSGGAVRRLACGRRACRTWSCARPNRAAPDAVPCRRCGCSGSARPGETDRSLALVANSSRGRRRRPARGAGHSGRARRLSGGGVDYLARHLSIELRFAANRLRRGTGLRSGACFGTIGCCSSS